MILRTRFSTGRVTATPAALDALLAAGVLPSELLDRHVVGDWGTGDAAANERALLTAERLLSEYALPTGRTVWVITEADRSQTTLLLPEDY